MQRIAAVADCLCEILDARISNKQSIEKMSPEELYYLLQSLGLSTGWCMDHVDYVYGALGILQFKIPKMSNPNATLDLFLYEPNHYMEMTDIKIEWFGTKKDHWNQRS